MEKYILEDEVTTSEYAASMGGSQVFLEPGEVQTVETTDKMYFRSQWQRRVQSAWPSIFVETNRNL